MHPSFSLALNPVQNPIISPVLFPARPLFPLGFRVCQTSRSTPRVASLEREVIEPIERTGDVQWSDEMELGFIEVGDIRGAHGVKGEVKVAPTTDFPEFRFGKPGKRWLKIRDGGKAIIKEIVLTKGRCNPGQNGWIIGFEDIDSIEQAKEIIGSTVMVRADDKPELEEGEFYTRDLIGMRVVLKETGELVGTLSSILTTKGNDILQVKPASEDRDSLILIPFVDEIVPHVDLRLGEMRIAPPKGLLEMNDRSGLSAKKEKRLMEWKQKKKSQQRLSTAKKILTEMEQIHVLDALRLVDKNKKPKLAKQIASFDFRLVQHAIKNLDKGNKGSMQDLNKSFSLLLKNAMNISRESLTGNDNEGNNNKFNSELRTKGSDIVTNSRAAIVIIKSQNNKIGTGSETKDEISNFLQGIDEVLKGEEGTSSGPVVIVAPTHETQTFEECLKDNGYFGLDHNKVWVLEEGRLPIFSGQQGSKILFKSPFEILDAPIGPGGVFSLLSFHKIVDAFDQMGVEYVQICSFDDKSSIGNPLFFGYATSLGADVGIKLHNKNVDPISFDIIISMKHINKINGDVKKLRFDTQFEKNAHVEKGSDGWVDVGTDENNSYRICVPIYGLLDSCLLDEVCVMDVVD